MDREENKQNKLEWNRKYLKIGIYMFLFLIVSAIAVKLIFGWDETSSSIGNFISALSPFLIGFFIAYLLNPAIKAMDFHVFQRLCHIKSRNVRELLAMIVTYLLMIGLIIVSFVFLIPQIGQSITDLFNQLPGWISETSRFLDSLVANNPNADSILKTARTCNAIFSGFISGKTVDSFIIGVLCFLLMSILQLPYALLISLIVGVTNMIPYFGPFIGAVPGALIILLISPWKMIVYLIMILVLQQFDGLYLGPKILGDSTGLRPIWIIFAITIGGALMGFVGMFLGVPCVAVISYLTGEWIDRRLEKRGIDSESLKIRPEEQTEEGWKRKKAARRKRWSQNGLFIKWEEDKKEETDDGSKEISKIDDEENV